ncbi:mitochondrial acidic protein MAM33-like [Tasmannia lanceolata]|uniref:mitochondrial acidic protein MAM33-like n=1 Tax=Tasmannia lanceolata TaxID=3420 RepID=UPI004062D762
MTTPRLLSFLHRNYRTVREGYLVQALQSELKHEKSSNPFQSHESGSLGDFVLDWDASHSQDVVLRRYSPGEEIAVSSLLGSGSFEENSLLPRKVLMKVCIVKPGLSPVLQFDCDIFSRDDVRSDFNIRNAYYLQSRDCLGASNYRGPLFSSLDPLLQKSLKEYLIAKGIGVELTNFLLFHLHKKEHGQYVNWLEKLETMFAK